jgi:hypothetical protein
LRDPSPVRDHTTTQWLAMLERAGFKAKVRYTWTLRLQFDELRIEADCSFTLQGALIEGRR